jgi:hypothetical protein
MANIRQITVGIQRVINLGNYENVRYEVTATAEVDAHENAEDVYQETLQFCKDKVGAELTRLKAK